MQGINAFFIRFERLLHPKIKEGIAKSLVYYFTLKEISEYQKRKYNQEPHVLDAFEEMIQVAHRGFSGEYPENTLLAFQKAIEYGADMVELDIQLSQEGRIVVCHDASLQRLAGVASFVRDLPYAHLSSYLPTLDEVFAALPVDALINIEIKHESSSFFNWHTEKAVLQCIRAHGREKHVLISAFNPMIVNRIRKLAPEISTAYLITQTLTPFLIFLLMRVRARYLHVDTRYLTPDLVRRLKQKGLKVLGYTLNTPAEYQWACDLGLQGIITDYPNRLRAFLNKN